MRVSSICERFPDLVPLAEHDQSLGLPAFEFGDPGGLSLQLVTEQLLFRLPLIKGPTVATAAALGCAVADDTQRSVKRPDTDQVAARHESIIICAERGCVGINVEDGVPQFVGEGGDVW